MGPGKHLTLNSPSSFYDIGFQTNGGWTGTVDLAFDNFRFTGLPQLVEHTLFSWETPDDPLTPNVDERYEGWFTTNVPVTPPPTVSPGHVHSITTTGATHGNYALQIDRRGVKGDGNTPETDAFVWGSVYTIAAGGDPVVQSQITDMVTRINGAAKIAFDVTYEDQFPINPSFTNFYVHFADESGVFYQANTPGFNINGALPGTTRTLEIPIANFYDAIPGSTKTLAVDGLSLSTTALEIGIATNTNDGAVYQIDNFRLITAVRLQADFDDSLFVDGDDLAIWQAAYGTTPDGDANSDGRTDGADFLIWQRELGSGITPIAVNFAGVPEPAG
ncbi:MAG TPA: hypothetical protein PKC18_08270, partial [Lacipirellulaceae bacterium]|nr:hypothetical protein [Lacipirellulaceae bacterium]